MVTPTYELSVLIATPRIPGVARMLAWWTAPTLFAYIIPTSLSHNIAW